ncbi:MAG: hypothetical protein Q8K79_21670, partial [Solirubrobacteraceae bacterium]|nr:hypothetical protein [Solirubrobacteraceae bacterium]
MSKSRAKKKQRRRARAAGPPRPVAQEAAAAGKPVPPRPSRLEVRDGVARPDAIWAPVPLTEIGMAVGLVLFLIGFT